MKLLLRFLLAALFLTAGGLHLLWPEPFLLILPPWIPLPLFCVQASGVAEIAGGLGLMLPFSRLQKWTGWGLVVLLIAVFPANVYMAVAHLQIHGFPEYTWENWARLPFQVVLIYLVVYSCNLGKRGRGQARSSPLTLSTR